MKKIFIISLYLMTFIVPSFAGTVPQDLKITLTREPCFGVCPVYSIEIFSNGKVVYEGKEFVRVKGRQEREISPDKVQKIWDRFKEVDFVTLTQNAAALKCENYMTDVPLTTISMFQNDTNMTMTHGNECYDHEMFKPLDQLADFLDQAVDGPDWYLLKR